jgi:hypothetical protein
VYRNACVRVERNITPVLYGVLTREPCSLGSYEVVRCFNHWTRRDAVRAMESPNHFYFDRMVNLLMHIAVIE